MKRFNLHLRPIDGRYFIDEDGVKHKAEQWEHLALRVANYRKRNGKPPGDPAREIEEQVCARQPDYCRSDSPVIPPPPYRENPGQMTAKIMKWLAGVLSLRRAGRAKKVPREEAVRRAAICAHCPQQKQMSSVCGACNATRKAAATALLGEDKRVNRQLGGCRVLSEDTSVSVHLEQSPVSSPELPAECWRRG